MNKSLVFLALFITSCQSAVIKTNSPNYPDLKGYFSKEIKRLEKERPEVQKSVHFNKKNETKTSAAIKWQEELDPFIVSDINKPAFKGLYRFSMEDGEETYTAIAKNLKTREIRILKSDNGAIKRITIQNFSDNNLFTSSEYLEYCPDSIYQIVKKQEVVILGSNHFMIVGKFRK